MKVESEEQYSIEEGRWLVALSRRAVEQYLTSRSVLQPPPDTPAKMKEKRGAFVTIRSYPGGELRGCIGRPEPAEPLVSAVIGSAVDSATRDPRFDPIRLSELDTSTFEVSILTKPNLIVVSNPLEYKKKVVVGRDGLIVEWSEGAGLLLPQVPVEEKWDVDTYLSYACMKAGAHPDYWLIGAVRLYSFQAEVFGEVAPNDEVAKKNLGGQA